MAWGRGSVEVAKRLDDDARILIVGKNVEQLKEKVRNSFSQGSWSMTGYRNTLPPPMLQ